jgi:hypothetical protein
MAAGTERISGEPEVKGQKVSPVVRRIKRLLDEPFWPNTLRMGESYFRTHDDCEGDRGQGVIVTVGPDGDVWISTTTRMSTCRFRNFFGGGRSLRVRNALLILAEAIRLDNEERPQSK